MASQQVRPIWFPIRNQFDIKMASSKEPACNIVKKQRQGTPTNAFPKEGQSITSPFFVVPIFYTSSNLKMKFFYARGRGICGKIRA